MFVQLLLKLWLKQLLVVLMSSSALNQEDGEKKIATIAVGLLCVFRLMCNCSR